MHQGRKITNAQKSMKSNPLFMSLSFSASSCIVGCVLRTKKLIQPEDNKLNRLIYLLNIFCYKVISVCFLNLKQEDQVISHRITKK